MIFRIRFIDGSQIDFQDVQKIATEDRETVAFMYSDPDLRDRKKIHIRKDSIIFLIEI